MLQRFLNRKKGVRLTVTSSMPDYKGPLEATKVFRQAAAGLSEEEKNIKENTISFETFLMTRLILKRLEHLPNISRKTLKQALESLSGYDLGLDYPIAWDAYHHQLFNHVYHIEISRTL